MKTRILILTIATFLTIATSSHSQAQRWNYRTGIFVNGRQLSPAEVYQASRFFGSVRPGFYWLNARGDYGYVGCPAMGNIWGAANRSGGRRESLLSGRFITGWP